MTAIIRAELRRLMRRRTIVVGVVAAIVFALVATLTVWASPEEQGRASRRSGATLVALAGRGGGTEAFAVGASFVGFLVFVTFIALIASEFSGGTFRALLLRDPHRARLIVGKFLGALLVSAGIVLVAELASFLLSLTLAPGKDIEVGSWFSAGGLTAALGDFATAVAGIAGWAIFGTALAVVFRSVPLALGVGFAWAGPFENIVVDSWSTGYRMFPGQVLGSLIRGGTIELGLGRAIATAVVYTAIAAAVALTLVVRRDVTT